MMRHEILLSQATPSLNEVNKMHWSARRKIIRGWSCLLLAERAHFIPKAEGKRRLIITRIGPRALDPDNLAGGMKQLLDAIRYLGLIKDDSPLWLDLEVRQERGEPATKIEIEEA